MKKEEKNLIKKLMSDSISKEEFLLQFPLRIGTERHYFLDKIEKVHRQKNADDLDDLLFLCFSFELFDGEYVLILCKLLIENWHHSHEDIVMLLQSLRDPRSTESLYQAATMKFEYLNYDDTYALAVKCCWALGDINTDLSREKLKILAKSDNKIIKDNAIFQLNRKHT